MTSTPSCPASDVVGRTNVDPYVFLVEDDPSFRFSWRRLLGDALREFESPSQVLAALQCEPALLRDTRCIVLDIHFEGEHMDGVELGEKLSPTTAAPILLCSGLPLATEAVPAWCTGQLPKRAYSLKELELVLSGKWEPTRDPETWVRKV